jgi:hypothetical protein
MHKISWTLFVLLALTLNGMAQSDVSKARWKSKEIVIDGNDREWAKPLNFYDDKSGLLFAICNDRQNVYFAFTVNDEMKMRKLMGAGWSIELSSKEKERKFNATLTFPAIKLSGMGKRPGSEFEKKVPGNPLIDAYRLQIQAIGAKGFLSNQTELKLNDKNGIDIAIGTDSSRFIVYEIAIPLKELMAGNSAQLDELINMNVSVNAMDRPTGGDRGDREGRAGRSGGGSRGEMSEMGGGMEGGGRSGGGRGGMGGGMGGGRGGMSRGGGGYSNGGSGDRTGLFEKASFKQKFTLTKE